MANNLFSKNLTQRRRDAKEERKILFLSAPLRLRMMTPSRRMAAINPFLSANGPKGRIKFGLIAVLFLLPVFLYAQDEGRSVQRLSWTGDEYTRRYEILIEKEEDGEYREFMREFTTALFIDVSLSPGKYRSRVITYDFLNQVGGGSDWMYIEVLAQPEPDYMLPDLFLSDTDTVLPIQDEQTQLADNKVGFIISAAWMPSFTIYDKGNRFSGQYLSLAGVTGRFGLLWASGTSSANYFNPGLELAVSYSFFDADSDGQTHLLTFGLNLLLLRWLPGDRMALTFRLGAGYNVLLPDDDGAFHTNMGLSFLLFVTDNWYLETGLDYAYWFSTPPANIFRPWIGVGFCKI